MAHTTVSLEIPATPERVWQLIGGFNSLPDWLPYIPSSVPSEGGRVRSLQTPGGEVIVERLEAFDQPGRSYTYSIVQAPFPVTGYQSTIKVGAGGTPASALVTWSGSFIPLHVSDDEAVQLFHGIYTDGLAALKQAFSC
ncbi:SRPBCC family protein [Janthinobacterium agaricidamnosum]|uniref:XoxI n=1 Tax=Janthinobacterium agaricidamnosum NBRC 102515 = DSM 9628 TaxID=1349767 RepID=W0V4Y5_9BURK|nr:SRPBCC family protein [Janthinobacterium agaricidamnosum]CDG83894.1 xoxI [Janthinobacterium agaricidamnosum NBRC 102515 = DSM 9628]